jgi:hypothetical protein
VIREKQRSCGDITELFSDNRQLATCMTGVIVAKQLPLVPIVANFRRVIIVGTHCCATLISDHIVARMTLAQQRPRIT